MTDLLRDVRGGLRALVRNPAAYAAAVLSLALGIGANTTVFSAVDALVLRPLPYPDSHELAVVTLADARRAGEPGAVSVPEFLAWRGAGHGAALAAVGDASLAMGADAQPVRGSRVSSGFFTVLGIPPNPGRGFTETEELAGADDVAVISRRLWENRFDGAPGAIGARIELDGRLHTIVGVGGPELGFPYGDVDVWVPLGITGQETLAQRGLLVLGRSDAPPAALQAELAAVQRDLAGDGAAPERLAPTVTPLRDHLVTPATRRATGMVTVAVAFVLLIACLNVAQLLLVRAVDRQHEIAVRSALGAGRARLVRQLLSEAFVVALAGGAVGLLLAFWGVRGLVRLLPAEAFNLHQVGISPRVLLFTAAASAVSALLFGLAPACQGARASLRDALGAGSRSATATGRRGRLLGGLVVAEVALALMLLVSAALLIRSFVEVQRTEPGYDAGRILTFRMPLPPATAGEPAAAAAFLNPLADRLAAVPGVARVGATSALPLSGGTGRRYTLEGAAVPPDDGQTVAVRAVTAGYHEAMGISILRGRGLDDADAPGGRGVAVINEAMARRHWGAADPVGSRVVFSEGAVEVVGVARDTRDWGPQNPAYPMVYVHALQDPPPAVSFVLRAEGSPAAASPAVRAVLRDAAPGVDIGRMETMEDVIARYQAPGAVLTQVLAVFAGIALLLAVVGVYGVVSYSVSRRTREIGVRMAMGAAPGQVMRMVARRGATLAAAGVALGMVLSLGATRGIRAYVVGISTLDPLAYGAGAAALLAAAVLACTVPALRATRVEPTEALRHE
jgi:putative ABC transport system permease protein